MRPALALVLLGLAACGGPVEMTPLPVVDAGDPEREALLSLAQLSPVALPKDSTNRFADDAQAAAFGQVLFFDPRFSGPLLESDNDGTHQGVGMQGETGKVSCASCHVAKDGFVDTRTLFKQLSLASGWTPRKTPSILDVGHAKILMWDGKRDSLQRQVLAVIESPMEGNSSRLFFAQQLARNHGPAYQALFGSDISDVLGAAYPQLAASQSGCVMPLTFSTTPDDACSGGIKHGVPGDGAEYDSLTPAQQERITTIAMNAGKAIAAYERKLSCGTSRFDAFMGGDSGALSDAEQRGAKLFVGKAQCSGCHSGPFMSDQKFHNVGLYPALVSGAFIDKDDKGAEVGLAAAMADPLNTKGAFSDGDDGRLPASVGEGMLGAFRTPMLRCVSKRPSFMHTAQLRSLDEVVKFFDQGGHARAGTTFPGYLGTNVLTPLGLTAEERADLVAFLKALDGPGPEASLLVQPM